MGHSKEKQALEYCLKDPTLQQVIGEKGVKNIQEYLLTQNAACPLKKSTNTLDKHYLTHPEGRINDKKEEPNCLVNMKGDSNTPKQKNVRGTKVKAEIICDSLCKKEIRHDCAKKNIKSTEQTSCSKNKNTNVYVPKCSCAIGKIIHSDTVAQTDVNHQKKNKRTSSFRTKNANTQSKVKYDADEIDTSRKKYIKQETKSACSCIGNESNELENMQQKGNMQTRKCNRFLRKRRRRRRTVSLWSWKVNKHCEVADPIKIKSYKQTSSLDCVSPNESKLKETSKFGESKVKHKNICAKRVCAEAYDSKSLIDVKKLKSILLCMFDAKKKLTIHEPVCDPEACKVTKPKMKVKACSTFPDEIPKVPCSCIPKEYRESKVKHKKICAKGICAEVYERKSLIDVNKVTSLIKCICRHSKKTLQMKPTLHESACDPEACKRDFKVTKLNKKDNRTGEPLIKIKETCKKKHEKIPKETEIRERFIAIPENAGDGTEDPKIRLKNTSKIKNKKTAKKREICERVIKTPKNGCDQTEEPLQIEVDAINRCILNPDEIKHKLTNLSHVRKSTCVCPSRKTGRDECEGKICQKMFKEKKTNFNCKCQHIKNVEGECTNRTCGSEVISKRYNECSKFCVDLPKMSEPQFEVKLDAKKMCILNSDEINKIIKEKEAEANEVCPGGACAVACEDGNNFRCKCVKKKLDITECSEPTCVDITAKGEIDLLYYWMLKLFHKVNNKSSHHRMRRNPFDTNEIRKIKSTFSFIRDRFKRTSEIWNGSEVTRKTGCSLAGLNQKQKYTVNNTNYHRRSGLKLPLKKSRPNKTSTTKTSTTKTSTPNPQLKKSESSSCGCANELGKEKQKQKKEKDKAVGQKQKLENKIRAKEERQRDKEIEELKDKDEATDTNCFTDFISGIFNLGKGIVACLIMVLFKIITQPRKSYRRTRLWMKDPQHTLQRMQRWAAYKWRLQKFYMSKSVKGSETMTTILDEAKETTVYATFASKGRTQKERQMIEAQSRRRQIRIRHRANRAIHGCRDVFLVTMRKTPCLWVYHICPDFYPRFLNLRTSCIQFFQVFLFCFAVLFWTPCILCMELCRGFICCVTCTI